MVKTRKKNIISSQELQEIENNLSSSQESTNQQLALFVSQTEEIPKSLKTNNFNLNLSKGWIPKGYKTHAVIKYIDIIYKNIISYVIDIKSNREKITFPFYKKELVVNDSSKVAKLLDDSRFNKDLYLEEEDLEDFDDEEADEWKIINISTETIKPTFYDPNGNGFSHITEEKMEVDEDPILEENKLELVDIKEET